MSSYGAVYVGQLPFDHSRNVLQSFYLRLFQDDEKKIVTSSGEALPEVLLSGYQGQVTPTEDHPFVYLETTLAKLRDRLDLLGYTPQTARKYYDRAMSMGGPGISIGIVEPPSASEWISGIGEIDRRLRSGEDLDDDATVQHLWQNRTFDFGFPGGNILVALRLMCEGIADGYFRYDITDLVQGGWVNAHEDLVAQSVQENADEHSFHAPIVVLTEGSSDCSALQGALEVLFPHLVGCLSFMDFGSHKAAGGAGELVKLVKAFAAAGVANRTVALFDNDSAAHEARRALNNVLLPERIAVIELPYVELLRNYPAMGPNGTIQSDVNGLAASIELYFGRDVLTRSDGALRPVRWGQYLKSVGAYQGEVEDKRELSKLFAAKVETAKQNRPTRNDPNWVEMRAVFDKMFRAFHEFDEKLIMKDPG